MKESFKLALIDSGSWVFAKKDSWLKTILFYVKEMGKEKVDLVVFPGAFVPRHVKRHYAYQEAEEIPGNTSGRLSKAAREAGTYIIVGITEKGKIFPEIYDTAVLISPHSGLLAAYQGIHLSRREESFFEGGKIPCLVETEYSKIGLMVGYDVFFPELPRLLALKGAEIIVTISCFSPAGVSALDCIRKLKLSEILRALSVVNALVNNVYYIQCDGVRFSSEKNSERLRHSQIINPLGETISELSSSEKGIIRGTIKAETLMAAKKHYSFFKDRCSDKYFSITKI